MSATLDLPGTAGIAGKDTDDLFGILDRQRMQPELIHKAETGNVYSNAERQRNDCNHGEAGTLAQLPKCIAKILNKAALIYSLLLIAQRHHGIDSLAARRARM